MTTRKPFADLEPKRGPIAWMVNNHVTPNIIMITLLVGGLFMAINIKKEVFPEFDLDRVRVSVSYPGASPEEVEQGIILAIEEGVRGLEGVKEVTATAGEGRGTVNVELLPSADDQKLYQDIQQEIARITTFPEDAEEPQIELSTRRRTVLSMQIYGDVSERSLRELCEQVRDRLLQDPNITQVDLAGVPPLEISIEISQENLRHHTLQGGVFRSGKHSPTHEIFDPISDRFDLLCSLSSLSARTTKPAVPLNR